VLRLNTQLPAKIIFQPVPAPHQVQPAHRTVWVPALQMWVPATRAG